MNRVHRPIDYYRRNRPRHCVAVHPARERNAREIEAAAAGCGWIVAQEKTAFADDHPGGPEM